MAYYTSFKDPLSGAIFNAEIKNGIGYLGGQRVTDYYGDKGYNVIWNPTETPTAGGAYGTYSFEKKAAPPTPAPVNNTRDTMNYNEPNYSGSQRSTQIPYYEEVNKIIERANSYTPRSLAELEEEARLNANLQIDPQVSSLARQLQEAMSAAESQRAQIEANYAGVQERGDTLLRQAEESALESAIRRGAGRSGVVNYETAKYKEPIMTSLMEQEAQKAANLTAIDNALALAQKQTGERSTELEKMRGQLVTQQLAALKQIEDAKAMGNNEMAMQAYQTLADLRQKQDQIEKNYAAQMMQYVAEPWEKTLDRQLSYEQTYGGPTPLSLAESGAIGLRQYLEGHGVSVEYDPQTRTVIIGGKRYTPAKLEEQGGELIDGRWYLPESKLRELLT